MSADPLAHYREVWLLDFEFHQPDGERPTPICMVAREWQTGRYVRLWLTDDPPPVCPFATNADALFVAYYASAEIGCFLALGWTPPTRILDLYAEFARHTSGRMPECGRRLLGALRYFGLDAMSAVEKESMIALAKRGGPFDATERAALFDYCQADVDALARLLSAMLPTIDLPRALLRGRYMAAAARIERAGVPIDVPTLTRFRRNWTAIRSSLVAELNRDFGVYVPTGVPDFILEAAEESGVDPSDLHDAYAYLKQADAAANVEIGTAVRAARKETGLTPGRMSAWLESGRDPCAWPGIDETARTLAGQYPALGIGPGFSLETNYDADELDGPQRLWDRLARPDPKPKTRDELLNESVAWVLRSPPSQQMRPRNWTFSSARFGRWLAINGIAWPRLESGTLALDDDTFRQMAKLHPAVNPLRELRHSLSELKLEALAVGADGRNRTLLSAFAAKTGRNQPSNAKFIFGPSVWLRSLIRPEPGRALAYIDYASQEFAIAAALSGDPAMKGAYLSGDPYLWFAKQAGAVPPEATKQSHETVRDQFKVCALAVQYGMGEHSLAQRLGTSPPHARDLLRRHREAFPRFWEWTQSNVDFAMLHNYLDSTFGWRVHVVGEANTRGVANFPMQANGAEMLRLACCELTEAGVEVHAPIHDAVLIAGPTDSIDEVTARAQSIMERCARTVLGGFTVWTDAKIVRYPDRYSDPRGAMFWDRVCKLAERLEASAPPVSDPWTSVSDVRHGEQNCSPPHTPAQSSFSYL